VTSPGGGVRVALDAVPLLDTRTGVGRFVHETIRRLATDPSLDLTAYGWPLGGKHALMSALPPGVRAARLPMAGPPLRAAWRRVDAPPIELWTGRVDVVHGPNFVVPPAWRAAELVTVHDLTVLRHPELCTTDTLEFPPLLRRALRRGAWVHTVSEFVRQEVIELLGVPEERVVCIPNGVTPASGGSASRGRELASSERYVLALGTIEPRKEFPRLVEAFDEIAGDFADVKLVVAGPDGWGADELRTTVRRAAHRDRVVRLGWVTEEDRASLLSGATVFAYPSRYEGFGLPPLEAMSAGVPVVTTRAGGITEVVADAAVLVPPGDTAALAAGLAAVLGDPDRAEALRVAGRANVTRFSWDRTADALADLYRRLADHPRMRFL
jgi:glycosyltransferase involved in cell wall biosynthesis